MEKNYNSSRRKLVLPEYGRHVQEMVAYIKTIEDKEVRNRQARAVIAVMGSLNPQLKESADFTHKLWDHLFLMAGFDLDVDSPYPIPSAVSLNPVPQRLTYPRKRIARKHYGKNLQLMIRALELSNAPREQVAPVVENIARFMRNKSYEFNQDHPNNEVIIKDIKAMSETGIDMDEEAINNLKNDYKYVHSQYQKKGGQQNRNNKKHKKNPQRKN